MTSDSTKRTPGTDIEQREHIRSLVGLPAVVRIRDTDHSARIVNIAPGGAMIETSAILDVGLPVTLRCGSIVADAIVMWSEGFRTGVNFAVSLSDRDLAEQVARTVAISSRRLRKRTC